MSGKRRKYTPEFREQAARRVIETGRAVAHAAADIGVGLLKTAAAFFVSEPNQYLPRHRGPEGHLHRDTDV